MRAAHRAVLVAAAVTGCYRRGFEPPPGGKACPASFTSQIASLSLKNILKHKHWIPNLEALVVDVEVRASTVRTLLDEHDLRDDLVVLSVDAEGHDQIIVRSVDPVSYTHLTLPTKA